MSAGDSNVAVCIRLQPPAGWAGDLPSRTGDPHLRLEIRIAVWPLAKPDWRSACRSGFLRASLAIRFIASFVDVVYGSRWTELIGTDEVHALNALQ